MLSEQASQHMGSYGEGGDKIAIYFFLLICYMIDDRYKQTNVAAQEVTDKLHSYLKSQIIQRYSHI